MSARARLRIDVKDLSTALLDAQDRLEELTERYEAIANAHAEAEDRYKRAYHREQVRLVNETAGLPRLERYSDKVRESLAMQACADEHGVYLLREAELKACREALHTARTRQDAIRTLIASERALIA